jgi:2-polyprenyl-3-methyl-5-hydroxy-6-metoxy-1,4-benzoquinol methylase
MARHIAREDLAYDSIASTWDGFINNYDTNRRIEVLVHDFLGAERLKGKTCLEGGCGLGQFSLEMLKFGPARILAVDIAPKLVARLAARSSAIETRTADVLALSNTVPESFDVVVSSEVIEHTPDPKAAVLSLLSRVASGGYLALSVPNRRWIWLLRLAQRMGLRKNYTGYENWVSPEDLKCWIEQEGFEVTRAEGIHLVPWQFLPKPLLRWLDRRLRRWSFRYALNLAILSKRREAAGRSHPSV